MKNYFFPFVGFLAVILIFSQCNLSTSKKDLSDSGGFNIALSSTVPSDLPANANDSLLATFAWNEFFALNWKASYGKDGVRDHPDSTWNYGNDKSPFPSGEVVWETYAHRDEARPFNGAIQPFNNAPHYNYSTSFIPDSNASFKLFDNLDEANEIGSCNLFAHASGGSTHYQVLYQAKVNSLEYNYVLSNYPQKAALKAARAVNANNIDSISNHTCNPQYIKGSFCLPCGSLGTPTQPGAIEVKTAWRLLTPTENAATYFTRKVITYSQASPGAPIHYQNKTYALIGIHIIHKTQNYPAFTFSTFEHVNVENDSMYYQLIIGKDVGQLIPSKRLHPISAIADSATAVAHRLVVAQNPKSVWQYYRLTGVQGKPIDYSKSQSDANFFLANFVIETDSTLANFNGSGIGMPHNHLPNTHYMGNFISMGGCQGCHGVAQKAGSDFSFIMVQDSINSPDIPDNSPTLTAALLKSKGTDPAAKFKRLLLLTKENTQTKPAPKKK